MTATPSQTGPSRSFVAATAIAALTTGMILVVVLLQPRDAWANVFRFPVTVPPDLIPALAAAALVALAWPARRTAEGLGYGLLVLATQTAPGVAGPAWSVYRDDPAAASWLATVALLVGHLAVCAATGAILTLFAAARGRRLGSWVGPVGWTLTLLAALGAVALAVWPDAIGSDPGLGAPGYNLGPSLAAWIAGWAANGLVVLVPLALGVAGSLRAAGRRHLATGRRGARLPELVSGGDRLLWAAVVAAIVAGWTGVLYPLEGADTGGAPAVAWVLIAMVVVRWSRAAAWGAIAISLAWSAQPALGTASLLGLASVDDLNPWGTAAALPDWWIAMVIWWFLLTTGAAAAWQAFAETRPPFPGQRWRVVAVVATALAPTLAIAGAGSLAGAVVGMILMPGQQFGDAWMPAVVSVPLGAGIFVLAQRRLVPAIAEAELAAGRPFIATRYLIIVVSEFVTGQAQTRVLAAEAERARIASDLHADVLPSIAQVLADNAAGAAPEQVAGRLRAVEREVRGLLAERRLVVLEEFGIVEALEWLVDQAEKRVAFPIDLTVDDRSTDDRPPRAVERAAFRIAQLAVENSIQHAQPSRLLLDVLVQARQLRVEVADDGRGAPPTETTRAAKTNHQGIADMAFHANQVQGRLEVGSPPAGGTSVAFAWTAG